MRFSALLSIAWAFAIVATAPLIAPAQAQTLEEYCAADPGLASCDPNLPETMEEYCEVYPGWAGCQEDAYDTTCESNPELEGCRDDTAPPIYVPFNPEDDAQDEEDLAEAIIEGLSEGDDQADLPDEEEASEGTIESASEFIDDIEEETAGELEHDQACATRARLTAQKEQAEFEVARLYEAYDDFRSVASAEPSETNPHVAEMVALDHAIVVLLAEMATLRDTGEPVTDSMKMQYENLVQSSDNIEMDLDMHDAQRRIWEGQNNRQQLQIRQATERVIALDRELESTPSGDCD